MLQHNAHYDENGDIVIEPDVNCKERTSRSQHIQENAQPSESKGALHTIIEESSHQFRETTKDAKSELSELKIDMRSVPKRVWAVAVSLWRFSRTLCLSRSLGSEKKPRPRSRFTLFAIDTVRFGGTFAFIFLFLFIGINYQSFWNIAKAELALGEDIETMQALSNLTSTKMGLALPGMGNGEISQSLQRAEGDLLAFLPSVGPPENRLIIPKIGKNVPIVVPPIDSLLNENWKEFEKDIQVSLRDGVVHYPGTAKPGQAGNFFITGHSSYYPWDPGKYKEIFARLGELDVGDIYSVYYGGDLYSYRVTKKFEVKPTNVDVLDQPTNKRKATLMTCTPIGTTLRRLIVQADEIDPATGIALHIGERSSEQIRPPKIEMLPI